jgi:ubiquinol-cytochrome c reductase cytochrome b subunit
VIRLRFSTPLQLLVLFAILNAQLASAEPKAVAGAQLFRDKGCAHCHGDKAQGTHKGPSLANVGKRMTESQMMDQIMNGGQEMPSFSDSVSKDEAALLVAFLRARHRPAIPPAPPEAVSNPAQ